MDDLKLLMTFTKSPVPAFFKTLSHEEQKELREYVETVISTKTDGLEELYYTIGVVIKFIPNFVLIPLTLQYIKPTIAAGVCEKLKLDQAVSLANDLPPEYIGEIAMHTSSKRSAQILEQLRASLAEKCIKYEGEHHPIKALEIGKHVSPRILKLCSKYLYLLENLDDSVLALYDDLIEKIRAHA